MIARVISAALPLFALALIGWGAWLAYPPAAPIAVGALIWIDLSRKDRQQ